MLLNKKNINREQGVALLIVTLMVILLSMLVMQVSHSTFLHSRSIGRMERNVQAEYLLKSVLNVGAALIAQDTTPNYDGSEDSWFQFIRGMPIPSDYLAQIGINYPGVDIIMEIVPENSKIHIASEDIRSSSSGSAGGIGLDVRMQYSTKRIFEVLGFDTPDLLNNSGQFSPIQKTFNSKELTSNIIDYLDIDQDSYSSSITLPDGDVLDSGIEGSLPENYFPKRGRKPETFEINELLIVPGMTPQRLRTLIPYARVKGRIGVNVNVANVQVLEAAHPDIDSTMAQQIFDHLQNNPPFKRISDINTIVTLNDTTLLGVTTRNFELISRVTFGDTKPHYIRARIKRGSPSSPAQISDITMY